MMKTESSCHQRRPHPVLLRELQLHTLGIAYVENNNIATDEAKRNGLGALETARFDAGISQIADDYEFRKRPTTGDIFDETFLPPAAARKLN